MPRKSHGAERGQAESGRKRSKTRPSPNHPTNQEQAICNSGMTYKTSNQTPNTPNAHNTSCTPQATYNIRQNSSARFQAPETQFNLSQAPVGGGGVGSRMGMRRSNPLFVAYQYYDPTNPYEVPYVPSHTRSTPDEPPSTHYALQATYNRHQNPRERFQVLNTQYNYATVPVISQSFNWLYCIYQCCLTYN